MALIGTPGTARRVEMVTRREHEMLQLQQQQLKPLAGDALVDEEIVEFERIFKKYKMSFQYELTKDAPISTASSLRSSVQVERVESVVCLADTTCEENDVEKMQT